jgi:hypothetical protein
MSVKMSVNAYVAAAAGALVIGTVVSWGVILTKTNNNRLERTVGMAPVASEVAKRP